MKIQAFVHPDTAERIRSLAAGRPIGEVLDEQFLGGQKLSKTPEMERGESVFTRPHRFTLAHPTFGKVCAACRAPKTPANERAGCPGHGDEDIAR